MKKFEDINFDKDTIVLDGHEYYRCKFSDCRIIVTRGNFVLHGCAFNSCIFDFGGEAANIKFLVEKILAQLPGSNPEGPSNE